MALEKRVCAGCGILFTPSKIGNLYHSQSCGNTASRRRYREKLRNSEIPLAEPKVCTCCNKEKPAHDYIRKSMKTCEECCIAKNETMHKKKSEKLQKAKESKDLEIKKKVCMQCGQLKPLFDFTRKYRSANYMNREDYCIPCKKDLGKEIKRIKAQKDREDRQQKKVDFLLSLSYHERVKYQQEDVFKKHIKYKYGISMDRYNFLLSEQKGLCAICGNPPEQYMPLHIDHNHETGAVRGLLCTYCNFGLGHFRDSAVNLQNAIKYLEKFDWS